MIAIELVRIVRNGQAFYVGRRHQDRHNLAWLGVRSGVMLADRNQTGLKRLRRAYAADFTFNVVRGAALLPMSDVELAMLSPIVVGVAA